MKEDEPFRLKPGLEEIEGDYFEGLGDGDHIVSHTSEAVSGEFKDMIGVQANMKQ